MVALVLVFLFLLFELLFFSLHFAMILYVAIRVYTFLFEIHRCGVCTIPSGWHYQRVTKNNNTHLRLPANNTHLLLPPIPMLSFSLHIYFPLCTCKTCLPHSQPKYTILVSRMGSLNRVLLPNVLSLIVQHECELVKFNKFSFTCEGIECKYTVEVTRSCSLHIFVFLVDFFCVIVYFIVVSSPPHNYSRKVLKCKQFLKLNLFVYF